MLQRISSDDVIPALKASFDHADARSLLDQFQVTKVALEQRAHGDGDVLVIDQTPIARSIQPVRHQVDEVISDTIPWPRWRLRTVFAENNEMVGISRTYGAGQAQMIQKELERRIFSVYSANTREDLVVQLRHNPYAGASPR